MKRNAYLFLILGIIVFYSCSSSTSPSKVGSIEGFVYDGGTGLALYQAKVITDPPTYSVTTDSLGIYTIENVKAGVYRVTADKFGYDSSGVDITVIGGIASTADIPLVIDSLSSN